MPPFADYLKMGVTKPSSNMVPKKGRSDLTEVSQATPNPVKTIAQGTASTAPLGMNSKIQNLANIPKMSVTKSPFNFTNLIGKQQGGLPNTDFLKMGIQGPTQQSMQEFGTKLDDANASIKDNKRQFVERVAKGGVITKKEIEEQMSGFDDNKKREFLSVLGQSNAKIEGIDFNNEPKEGFTIGNTNISVNPIKQVGEKILEAKEYLKNNPQADPVMKTLLQGIISTFDPTGGLATSGLMQTDTINNILPKTDNPLTQGVMGFAGNTARGVGQVIEGGAGLVDKSIAGTQSLVQGGDMSQYQTRQTGIGEDILDVGAGATQSLASLYAMPASILIGAGIEALPPEGQKAVSDTMIGLGDIIAKTPGLSQWMESLPHERRDEFKSELAGAAIGMLGGLKGKSNIVKNPRLFLRENLNPVQIAKNFNENVIGIPSKALDMAVSTVGKIDFPDVNMPTMKGDKLNKISEGLVASTFKQPAMREKYISKVGQTPEKTLLEAGIKGTLEDQTRQVLELSKQSAKKARSEASKINETFASPEGIWITDKILEGVDTSIPGIQKKLQPILDMNQRFKDGTATTNDLIDAKTFLSRYEQIYDDFGRVKKTGDTFEKEALADMYSTMKTQVEDLGAKYGIDMEKINYDTMKFEGLRGLMTRALSRESNRDIMGLSDYILGGYGATIDPVSTLLVVGGKKLLQSPNVSSRIANLIYKKKGDNFISRMKKNDTSISRTTDSNMASKNIQGTIKSPALPEKRSVDYLYEGKKPIDLGSNLDKNGNVIKKYTAQDLLQEVRAKKTKSETVKSSDVKAPYKTDNKKLSDSLLNKLNNPKKSVQSDTLVSKADEMEADRLANAQYIKEDIISNVQSIAKKNPEAIRKLLQKDGLPDNKIQSFIDDASNGKISERQAKNVSDALVSKADDIKPKNILAPKSGIPVIQKDLQPLYEEARKYKSFYEFAKNKLTAYHGKDKVINELDDRKIFFFVGDNAESFSKKFGSQTTRADISNLNVLKEGTKEYDSFIKNNMGRNIEPHLKYSKQNLSNLGYDAIEKEGQYIGSKEIVVYNPSKIKTEAQLRKIREEANKK